MNKYLFFVFVFFLVQITNGTSTCGCKDLRPCYEDMLRSLQDKHEEACIENAAIGISTVLIFLKALKQFCPDVIDIVSTGLTYEGRKLYEVAVTNLLTEIKPGFSKPVIIIDAGQQAGVEPVGMALYVIEQLIACQEHNEMLENIKWVILPCTNPDGMEFARFNRIEWRKNLRPSGDKLSIGVDISRNFEIQWRSCEKASSSFSPNYPGLVAASENETKFIQNVIVKYKKVAKGYLSIRRDGHALLFPYAFEKNEMPSTAQIRKVAGEITSKVNLRAGTVQQFVNSSIFTINSRGHCGHSVDYAFDHGIPFSYEMRVFLGGSNRLMSMFQTLPKGFESSLRSGYFNGIKELYNIIITDKKFDRVF